MRNMRYFAATAAALTLATTAPVWAAEGSERPAAPVQLTDHELDQVTAGEPLLNINVGVLIQDINVNVDVFVPINVGVIAQVNALGNGVLTATQLFAASFPNPTGG